jgi:hypothetical protein
VRPYYTAMEGLQREAPAHNEVVAAVAATGDPELASWVASPDSYVLVPVRLDEAEHHDFFELIPLAASHPIGVLLARQADAGTLVLTSGHPEAVWRVLRADPALAEPNLIVQLLAPSWDSTEYVGPGSEPPVATVHDGWRCDLRVRDRPEGDVERWRVILAESSSWQVE